MSEQIIYETDAKPLNPLTKLHIKITTQYLITTRGTVRSDMQQIPLAQIFDVDAHQSITQKTRGVGTITAHIRRSSGVEEPMILDDIPAYDELVRLINDASLRARQFETQMQNTWYGMNPQMPQHQAPPPAPASVVGSSSDDIMAQIQKLGDLHDAGILNDAEFTAKKAELLARL